MNTIDAPAKASQSDLAGITLSIIIPSYNNCRLLVDCLRSIEQNPPSEPYEIIVVDDASIDDTSEVVRAEFPQVRLLRNDINRNYGYSNNRAFEMAKGEFLFLLNNDTIVLPKALDLMIQFSREHPDAGSVGCKLLNEDGSLQWSVKTLPSAGSALFGTRSIITKLWPGNPFTRQHLQHLTNDMALPFIAGYVSSAAVMIPRHVVQAVGGLDPRLTYHVDADYCKRIANLGYNIYYLPTATIIHLDHKGGTMVSVKRRFRAVVEFHRGSYIYYQKHMQKSVWSPMHFIVIMGLLARFTVSVSIRCSKELIRAARLPDAARGKGR